MTVENTLYDTVKHGKGENLLLWFVLQFESTTVFGAINEAVTSKPQFYSHKLYEFQDASIYLPPDS